MLKVKRWKRGRKEVEKRFKSKNDAITKPERRFDYEVKAK